LIVVMVPLTWRQCATWHDSNTLRVQALRVGSGRDALIESNLGIDLFTAGRVEEGMTHLRRAVALDPNLATAHSKLGQALFKQGDIKGAIARFEEEVRLSPDRPEAHQRLGVALSKDNRTDEAAAQFAEARRLEGRPGADRRMPGNGPSR
jgi:Flp pilus assembly protein TadD